MGNVEYLEGKECRLDEEGARTIRVQRRDPAICGYFVTLHNFYGNAYFHFTPEQFMKLMEWGEKNRPILEELLKEGADDR